MAYLNWSDAPDWATHIVGDSDIPCIQCWAKKVGNNYYNETFQQSLVASFHMVNDDIDDEPGIWMVVSARPVSLKEGE
jgi:hypothetical protein